LLPHIAREEEMDRVSSGGYALGYLGSGLLLVLIILWIENPAEWGFADSGTATRTGFFAVALWWTVFSIPILRNLREPARLVESDEAGTAGAVRAAFHRLLTTFREFKGDHRQAFILLLAILVYSDGIGTIIRMAAIYASTQGLPQSDVILAILIVQFVGVPFSSLFGWMAGRIGTRNAIFIGLAVYSVITVVAFFMDTVLEFYVMAVLVATVQGGTQALSRSLFASMIPKHRTSEYFGFFSVSDKVAGILGPLVFSTLLTVTGSSRLAILSVLVFFLGGGILLWFVNVGLGHEEARNAERRAVRNTNQPAI
jgi:UMF1 family MFS transporter